MPTPEDVTEVIFSGFFSRDHFLLHNYFTYWRREGSKAPAQISWAPWGLTPDYSLGGRTTSTVRNVRREQRIQIRLALCFPASRLDLYPLSELHSLPPSAVKLKVIEVRELPPLPGGEGVPPLPPPLPEEEEEEGGAVERRRSGSAFHPLPGALSECWYHYNKYLLQIQYISPHNYRVNI